MTVRAKIQLGTKFVNSDGSTQLNFYGVYSTDPASENKAFTDSTPAINVIMNIAKDKPAAERFEAGKEYYLDFKPVIDNSEVQPVEAVISDIGQAAPRVTPGRIQEVIVDEAYVVFPDSTVTVCMLTLSNGAKVLGHNYGSIDPASQDWKTGHREARAMAVEKVWELEGYLLRNALSQS